MLAAFQATLSPMMVMFLCIVIGYVLNRKKVCPENTGAVLSRLESNLLIPALVINIFMKYCTVESLKQRYSMVLYAIVSIALAVALAYALARFFVPKGYQRNVYQYALACGNFGFMGNAVILAMFGESTLYEYLLFCLPLHTVVYTWGVVMLVPQEQNTRKGNPFASLMNPTFLSLIIGAVLGLINAQRFLPGFVATTLENLGACMGPIAMVLTGFIIGGYEVRTLLKNRKIYVVTALRLVVIPLVFVLLFKLLGADQSTLMFILFAYGTPMGLNTVVYPAAYGGDTSTGAAMATISHTLSVISLPVMYALLTAFV